MTRYIKDNHWSIYMYVWLLGRVHAFIISIHSSSFQGHPVWTNQSKNLATPPSSAGLTCILALLVNMLYKIANFSSPGTATVPLPTFHLQGKDPSQVCFIKNHLRFTGTAHWTAHLGGDNLIMSCSGDIVTTTQGLVWLQVELHGNGACVLVR